MLGEVDEKRPELAGETMAARLPQEAALFQRDATRRKHSTKPLQTHSEPAHSTTKRTLLARALALRLCDGEQRNAVRASHQLGGCWRVRSPCGALRGAVHGIRRVSRAKPRTRLDQGSQKAKRQLGERRGQKGTAIGAGRKLHRFVNSHNI